MGVRKFLTNLYVDRGWLNPDLKTELISLVTPRKKRRSTGRFLMSGPALYKPLSFNPLILSNKGYKFEALF